MTLTEEELKAEQEAEMGGMLDTPAPEGDASATGEPPPPAPEGEGEPKPEPSPEPTPAPAPEPTPTPISAPVAEPTEAERLAADNARLRAELNEQARHFGAAPQPTLPSATPPEPAPTAPTAVPGTPLEFLTAAEAEQLVDKPAEVLNAALNRVYQAGREAAMREMPTLVRQQALSEITIQQRVQKFWSDNKDLEPYKDFCSMTANQIEIENPNLGFAEVLEKTGERVRERLKLPAVSAEPPEPPSSPAPELSATPALPTGQKTARKPVPVQVDPNSQAAEMEAILNF